MKTQSDNLNLNPRLKESGTTIFSVMSALAAKHDAINLSQGFPDFDGPSSLIDNVYKHMKSGKNQYAPMPGLPELRKEIAQKYNDQYQCNLNADTEITVTAGATQAIFTFIMSITAPGDEVILFSPAYDCYAPAIRLAGGIPIYINLKEPDFSINQEKLEQAFNKKTKLILVNNPHNPCGSMLKKEDIECISRLTQNTNCLVLSDEVYEHIVFDKQQFKPMNLYEGLEERTLCVYSFGKSLHFTGWKIGYAIGSPELTKVFRNVHQYNVFSVNTPVQYALADFLKESKMHLKLADFYQKKRDYFYEGLLKSKLKPLKSAGTYFLLADYSAVSDMQDTEFAAQLTKENGVAAIPLSPFYPPEDKPKGKFLRFCFAKQESTLQKALENIWKI